jgi:hypothetical protein
MPSPAAAQGQAVASDLLGTLLATIDKPPAGSPARQRQRCRMRQNLTGGVRCIAEFQSGWRWSFHTAWVNPHSPDEALILATRAAIQI